MQFLEFERPIAELEARIAELRQIAPSDTMDIGEQVQKLEQAVQNALERTYAKLTPWQKTLVARHPDRPHGQDVIDALIEQFSPLAGDRMFAEDAAIIGGVGRFRGRSVVALAQEKGHDTETRIKHNFGMAKPEGYRKAKRLMEMAERFRMPLLTFVDTAGAYPGLDAEARGQSQAIAACIETGLALQVPFLTTVIGEGGSGGAIALATGDAVLMMEHAIYSVISPEGCASILWRDGSQARTAAEALKLTAQDLLKLGIADEIIPEPLGGAHRDPAATMKALGDVLESRLEALITQEGAALRSRRRDRFLDMGRKLEV